MDLIFTLKIGFYVGIITIRFLVILSFFPRKSEKKKLVIFSKINSGFFAKLVFPPLDVGCNIWSATEVPSSQAPHRHCERKPGLISPPTSSSTDGHQYPSFPSERPDRDIGVSYLVVFQFKY